MKRLRRKPSLQRNKRNSSKSRSASSNDSQGCIVPMHNIIRVQLTKIEVSFRFWSRFRVFCRSLCCCLTSLAKIIGLIHHGPRGCQDYSQCWSKSCSTLWSSCSIVSISSLTLLWGSGLYHCPHRILPPRWVAADWSSFLWLFRPRMGKTTRRRP